MTKFAMTRWKTVPEYCPWSTYFKKCATVRGARSGFNSSVKLPNEVTTRICGEPDGAVEAAGAAGLVCALAAAGGVVGAPSAGLGAGVAAGVAAATDGASAARNTGPEIEINPRTSSSCLIRYLARKPWPSGRGGSAAPYVE